MKKDKYIFEIYLTSKNISKDSWLELIKTLSKYVGYFHSFKIIVVPTLNTIKYYVEVPCMLPSILGYLEGFIFKKTMNDLSSNYSNSYFYFTDTANNFADIIDREELKHGRKISHLEIKVNYFSEKRIIYQSYLFFKQNDKLIRRKLLFAIPQNLLSINFSQNNRYFYSKSPNYLNIQKILHLLKSDSNDAILQVDTFPYLPDNYYLNQNSYSFDKHSMIVGSSGSGKSKFISLLVNNISSNLDYKLKYKVVIIDPHDALCDDVGGLPNSKVIDFQTLNNSIDLFSNNSSNIIASVELIVSLFKSLMNNQFNAKLERVLRHSTHLLLSCNKFSFQNLRKLLLNVEFRNILLKELKDFISNSINDFFLTDFSELKASSYNEAIAPIITFIDEMELIPVFNSNEKIDNDITSTIQNNFLTIFSLNRTVLGEKCVKTISGMLMRQILELIQERKIHEHIILIVDEVSVIENPLLINFLSEARKYGLSIILSQQYFSQISESLRNAIFANVVNYYIFRVSKDDASILSDNISMKLIRDDTKEEKIKILTNLNDRECISRIGSSGLIFPAFKAKTVNFIPKPKERIIEVEKPIVKKEIVKPISAEKSFEINSTISLTDLLINQSSSRKNMRGDKND